MATRSASTLPAASSRRVHRALQVALATTLVAGCPVAVVWWLRESSVVTSTPLALLLGMALSLLANWAGQTVWEKLPSSEDLLFNELMVWGYVQRLRKQRRLADTANLISEKSAEAQHQRRLLERMVAGMETRDPYLHGHSRRVARHAWAIAQHMKLPREEVAKIRAAATLHDVGKTKTPKTILHKPGRLTDEEYRIIQLHPGEGAAMTCVLRDPDLDAMVRHHHERLDGTGYPDGLAGEAIPLGARIIAVADTFDAITSARPYRAAAAHKKAIDILHEEAGTRLDPDVVKAFCNNYAGRGPLALWSFVSGLPERLVTWLSGSVGAVASAAKVVAVAAVVGGGAAASSTLSLVSAASPRSGHGHGAAQTSVHLPTHSASSTTSAALNLASSGSGPHNTTATRHGHHHREAAPAGAHRGSVVSTTVKAGSGSAAPASSGESRLSGGGAASSPVHSETVAGKSEEAKSKAEETKPKKEETKATKEETKATKEATKDETKAAKEETKAKKEETKAKKEESPSKKEEAPAAKKEEHGKSSEAPGHVKKEEASPAPVPVAGGGEESSSHGKSGEAPGKSKGASEALGTSETPGKGKGKG